MKRILEHMHSIHHLKNVRIFKWTYLPGKPISQAMFKGGRIILRNTHIKKLKFKIKSHEIITVT